MHRDLFGLLLTCALVTSFAAAALGYAIGLEAGRHDTCPHTEQSTP